MTVGGILSNKQWLINPGLTLPALPTIFHLDYLD